MLKEAETVSSVASQIFGQDLVGVYLYGSGVSGASKPLSDIDLLVVIERPMFAEARLRLAASLLRTSGRYPNRPGEQRCLELSVVLKSELAEPSYPGRCEFLYGEWLRADFERGPVPEPFLDPGVTLMLAQARLESVPIKGPELSDVLTPISAQHVRRAMRDAIPSLVSGLQGDERNVLLTLARMWRTAATGEFVSKDAAASWVAPLVPIEIGETLGVAAEAYLGKAVDDWSARAVEAQQASDYLEGKLLDLL